MKYSIEPMTIEPEFRWGLDGDGDWSLYSRIGAEPWLYWGLVHSPRSGKYVITNHGRVVREEGYPTLGKAKSYAEEICAGDILRNLAKIKKETASQPTKG